MGNFLEVVSIYVSGKRDCLIRLINGDYFAGVCSVECISDINGQPKFKIPGYIVKEDGNTK